MGIVYEGYGNVLNHKAQTITCPVNLVGVMGCGLALAMKNRIKGLFDYYKFHCQEGTLSVGKCITYDVPDKEKQVLLFPSKLDWQNDSEIEYVESALKYLSSNVEKLNIKELAIVPVGCGYGKLDYFKDVRPLFIKYLGDLKIDVYILLREHN